MVAVVIAVCSLVCFCHGLSAFLLLFARFLTFAIAVAAAVLVVVAIAVAAAFVVIAVVVGLVLLVLSLSQGLSHLPEPRQRWNVH